MDAATRPDAPLQSDWRAPELAVIVPSFNERGNIAELFSRLTRALADIPFEVIVVDDNSPDGTADLVRDLARTRPNLRCIRRVGRRGLSSAVIEGMSATAAPYVAVIDADLQHDEAILPLMLAKAKASDDIVVGTRYAAEGSVGEGLSRTRAAGSRLATRLSSLVTGKTLSDPMSGFFLMRRDEFDAVAASLSDEGFKILLDIIVSATRRRAASGSPLRIGEVPYTFRPRHAGESKMSSLVAVQFLGLLVSKLSGGLLPTSFLLFGLVGGLGVVVHMAALLLAHEALHIDFLGAQVLAAVIAMTFNFALNNELTYANKKLRGWRYLTGLATFYAVCSIGLLANVSVASWIYAFDRQFYLAALFGVFMSVVFNYSVTRVFTWR
jgi:dolichol-phosphate mannosyltransferase